MSKMSKRRKKKKLGVILLTAALVFFALGLDPRLVVRRYTVKSDKLTAPVRVLFLSDLHSCDHGREQRTLLELALAQEPDLILLGGDWVDDDFGRRPPERAYQAARALAKYAPTFYVIGNHEIWSGYGDEIKEQLSVCGVRVLAGEAIILEINGQTIRLCGIDDPMVGEEKWGMQLEAIKRAEGDDFSLLLSHRPERVEQYGGFDLVLAGHAHGGQWRIPGLVNGLFAPDQGWFPAYAGGKYRLEDGGVMIVGRGLSKESTRVPRFFDRPEVVVVDLAPEG